ncbi:MAG: hypothetical protein HY519_02690, partial [Candidatus Aenigmarchaeota archaeon]|nr:hypothetical protein [Candidatus Aenigmarchaeota archaeon]
MASFRPARLVKVHCTFPKNAADSVLAALQQAGIAHVTEPDDAGLEPAAASERPRLDGLIVKASHLLSLAGEGRHSRLLDRMFGARTLEVKMSGHAIGQVLASAEQELGRLEQQLASGKAARQSVRHRLLQVREELGNIDARLTALEQCRSTDYFYRMAFWVEQSKLAKAENIILSAAGKRATIEAEDAQDDAPTLLGHGRWLKPFELLTSLYGLPKYNDIDPTLITAISFPLLFGLMFPDAGYGLILTMVSLFAYLHTTKNDGTQRSLNVVLLYCGLASIASGLAFGEFFGGLVQIHALAFEPANNIMLLMYMSVTIGIVHMSIGLLSKLIDSVAKKRFPARQIGWLVIIWPLLLYGFSGSGFYLYATVPGLLLLLASQRSEFIEDFMSIISNVFSYLRIGIIAVTHIFIARLLADFLLGIPLTPVGIALGVLVFTLAALGNFVLSVFIVFIQSLRLHWLEFFSKLQLDRGQPFR